MIDSKLVAVIGGSGFTGTRITNALLAAGVAVRIVSRQAVADPRRGVAAANASLHSVDELQRAITGAAMAYVIPPRLNPNEVDWMSNVITALEAESVSRAVYHSVLHAFDPDVPHHLRKARVENTLRHSSLLWSVLQPCSYAQNNLRRLVRTKGKIILPIGTRADAPGISYVDLNDIAETAARVLLDERHIYGQYELAGPAILSAEDVASQVSAHLNEPVEIVTLPITELEAPGAPLRQIADAAAYTDLYDQHGFPGNSFVLSQLLGRSARSLHDVIERELRAESIPKT